MSSSSYHGGCAEEERQQIKAVSTTSPSMFLYVPTNNHQKCLPLLSILLLLLC
jgi:hypothetical protein